MFLLYAEFLSSQRAYYQLYTIKKRVFYETNNEFFTIFKGEKRVFYETITSFLRKCSKGEFFTIFPSKNIKIRAFSCFKRMFFALLNTKEKIEKRVFYDFSLSVH